MKDLFPTVLVVEDDLIVFDFLQGALSEARLIYSATGTDVLPILKQQVVDVVFVDLLLPEISGHDIIQEIRSYDPSIEIIVISSTSDIDDAINAFQSGISEYIKKPLNRDHVRTVFDRCLVKRRLTTENRSYQDLISNFDNQILIGDSDSMKQLNRSINEIAGFEVDVLITGESGVGKELVAKTLHRKEGGPDRPYITVNCSAIPENLIESVLFGHEKGSFTGAVKKQLGKFELANGGDIFLDEISTLPLNLQAKLLRVIQEREIEPIGLGYNKKLNFRVIAACNENLMELVEKKLFRKDLFYRLNKFTIKIPPLREHLSDIESLAAHFLRKHARRGKLKRISQDTLEAFKKYHWPGNIRELENTIENLIITSANEIIEISDLKHLTFVRPPILSDSSDLQTKTFTENPRIEIPLKDGMQLSEVVELAEKSYIRMVVDHSDSKQKAATRLGMDRRTLYRKIKQLNI